MEAPLANLSCFTERDSTRPHVTLGQREEAPPGPTVEEPRAEDSLAAAPTLPWLGEVLSGAARPPRAPMSNHGQERGWLASWSS